MSQSTMFASQVESIAQEETTIQATELNDAPEVDEAAELKKATMHRAKFQKMIMETRREQVAGYQASYETRQGLREEFEVFDSEALLYIMEDQPNEPQLTANATETRSGSMRMSDEA